jgi:hypothetical protein
VIRRERYAQHQHAHNGAPTQLQADRMGLGSARSHRLFTTCCASPVRPLTLTHAHSWSAGLAGTSAAHRSQRVGVEPRRRQRDCVSRRAGRPAARHPEERSASVLMRRLAVREPAKSIPNPDADDERRSDRSSRAIDSSLPGGPIWTPQYDLIASGVRGSTLRGGGGERPHGEASVR